MVILIHALKFHSMPADHDLNRHILVVAFRLSKTWLARMGVVAQRSEWQRVIDSGRNVREPLARSLFPEFDTCAYESRK